MEMDSRKIMENDMAWACGIHKGDEKGIQALLKKIKERTV
jgi:hypothetical protein